MERSYGFPSNFASKQIIFMAHIGELYHKGLEIPSLELEQINAVVKDNGKEEIWDLSKYLCMYSH